MEKFWVFHIFPEAPLPPLPRGRGLCAEEETASALLPRSFAFLKKEMKFLLTERLRSSSSSAGKNGKAPRSVFLAKRYRLAWKLRRRFRPLASDYTIFCSPQGKKSSCKHNYRSLTGVNFIYYILASPNIHVKKSVNIFTLLLPLPPAP